MFHSARYLCLFMIFLSPAVVQSDEASASASVAPQQESAEKSESEKSEETPESESSEESSKAPKEDGDASEEKGESESEGKDAGKKANEIKLGCYFVSQQEHRIILRPLEWAAYPILEVAAHGSKVNRGDALLVIDARKLDAAIEDLQNDISEAELSLAETEREQEIARRTDQMAMEAAERAERYAAENLKRFLTQERGDRVESLAQSVKSAENRLAYVQEEYNQLKRMYEADDLTEDTEEIVLRRSRDSVDNSEYSLERYRRSHDRGMDVELPRTQIELEESLRQATLALERARISMPGKVEKREIALAKKHLALERQRQRLERLQQDREMMEVTAPISGWVYYGEHRHGKWSDSAQVSAVLRPGLKAKASQTLMTVVRDDQLELQGTIDEQNLAKLAVGNEGVAKATAYADQEFTVVIEQIGSVPVSTGKFAVTLGLRDALPEGMTVTPGMTCGVTFTDETSDEEAEASE